MKDQSHLYQILWYNDCAGRRNPPVLLSIVQKKKSCRIPNSRLPKDKDLDIYTVLVPTWVSRYYIIRRSPRVQSTHRYLQGSKSTVGERFPLRQRDIDGFDLCPCPQTFVSQLPSSTRSLEPTERQVLAVIWRGCIDTN